MLNSLSMYRRKGPISLSARAERWPCERKCSLERSVSPDFAVRRFNDQNKRRHRCDVEHSSQLAENILDVFGVDFQDGKLPSDGQASVSEEREHLHSGSHIGHGGVRRTGVRDHV